ncbi:hypothetical protein CYMTET_11874 [Cymbomonas tetramitiformis]|uniref:Cyclic nucleotide-binding domain-containing protein n=1 Tax=Cymbomonas tetramitiformis TaxID=36881 RepID=A0AAE0LD15_9CHLO|nr:hypothetical protein CYMTET_11874 [Cymbomonas tetramitiformis]
MMSWAMPNPHCVYTTSQVSSIVFEEEKQKAEEREKMAKTVGMLKGSNLPANLASEIVRTIFKTKERDARCNVDKLYALMSFNLRVKVARFCCHDTLRNVPILRACSSQFLNVLAVVLREVSAIAEEVLFEQDAVADCMYILTQGKVQVTEGEASHHSVTMKNPGASIGELPVLLGTRHTCTAQVKTPAATLFVVRRDQLMPLLLEFPDDEVALHEAASFELQSPHHFGSGSRPSSARRSSIASDPDGMNTHGTSADAWRVFATMRKRRGATIAKLCQCAKAGNIEHMAQLLRPGIAEINDQDANNRAMLAVAASEGQLEAVEYLLQCGASPAVTDGYGNTPINDALRGRHYDVAEKLKLAGASVEYASMDMASLVCTVAHQGDVDYMRHLLYHGLDVTAADYDQRTALHLAASEGHVEMVELLLEFGADMEARDKFGNSPLADAVRESHTEVQQSLYTKGARLMGHSIQLCEAAAKGELETLVELCKNGADPNCGDYDKRTCLHLACSNGHNSCVDFLLRIPDIDINALDNFGGTPMDDALRHQHFPIVLMLTKLGALQGSSLAVQRESKAQNAARSSQLSDRVKHLSSKIEQSSREHQTGALVTEVLGQVKVLEAEVKSVCQRLREVLDITLPTGDNKCLEVDLSKSLLTASKAYLAQVKRMAKALSDTLDDVNDYIPDRCSLRILPALKSGNHKGVIQTIQRETKFLMKFVGGLNTLCDEAPHITWDPLLLLSGDCSLMLAAAREIHVSP